LLDVLSCDHLTISRVVGNYDSSFLHDLFSGVRFPAKGYKHLTINDLTLRDIAPDSYVTATEHRVLPFSGNNQSDNTDIQFHNVTVYLNRWSRADNLQPTYKGTNHHTDIKFIIQSR
jgi:hypothetical protein